MNWTLYLAGYAVLSTLAVLVLTDHVLCLGIMARLPKVGSYFCHKQHPEPPYDPHKFFQHGDRVPEGLLSKWIEREYARLNHYSERSEAVHPVAYHRWYAEMEQREEVDWPDE